MKLVSIAGFLLTCVVLALAPAISTVYREAFPADTVRRAALAACAEADPGFDRLFADSRAKCYARQLQLPQTPQIMPRAEEIADAGS